MESSGELGHAMEAIKSGLFSCVVCETDITPTKGISVHARSFFSGTMHSWKGLFLCASYKLKKDAMERKRLNSYLMGKFIHSITAWWRTLNFQSQLSISHLKTSSTAGSSVE